MRQVDRLQKEMIQQEGRIEGRITEPGRHNRATRTVGADENVSD
jgi:hypothetical protein